MSDLDVFSKLPPFIWRGQQYPITSREVSFTHEGVRHKFQFRDGEAVEQTGAQALTFSYTIPMRQGIAKGPYKNLYTKGLPGLFADCYNRDRDTLFDPVYGNFLCVPTSYRDVADPTKRDGVDVSVEFVRSFSSDDLDALPDTPTVFGVISEAGALEQALKSGAAFKDLVSGPGGTTDFLSALAGAGAALQQNANKIRGGLEALAFKADKLDKQIDALENPQLWGVQDSARKLRESALRLKAHGDNPGQRLVTVTQKYAKTLNAVAAEAHMTLEQLLKLNPGIARSPMVTPGTVLKLVAPPV